MAKRNAVKQKNPSAIWRALTNLSADLYTFIVRLPWVLAVIVIGTIVIQSLTQTTTVIKEISVPKTLAESGYTSDVAGHRMRDALYDFRERLRTRVRGPEVALAGDLPTIVVPTVGISLDAVVSSIRTVFRSTRSRTITGEITINNELLWLLLRIDGQKFYQSQVGTPLNRPDELFNAAAFDVMKAIRPYLAAASLADEKPDAALAMVEDILSRLAPGDEQIAWFHNLQAYIYLTSLKDYDKAAQAIKLSLAANKNYTGAIGNNGLLFLRLGKLDEAIAEYKKAINLDPNYAVPYVNLGSALQDQNKTDEAIAEYKKAINLDPNYSIAHFNLGVSLEKQNKFNEAIAEYKRAIDTDPRNSGARINLGAMLQNQNKIDEAVAEYKKAVEADPKNAIAHNNLGSTFQIQNRIDEAIAEFKTAIDLDPNYARPHLNLGIVFKSQNKTDEATVEFKKARALESGNAAESPDIVEDKDLNEASEPSARIPIQGGRR
jgi:Tfp pilus assembly protein PilF